MKIVIPEIFRIKSPKPGHTDATPKSSSNPKIGIFSVMGAVVLWSSSYIVTKVGVGAIPPLSFAAIRFVIATIVIGILFVFVKPHESVSIKDLFRFALGGLLGITAYFSLQNLGVEKTSASDATLLIAFTPVITLVLEVIFRKARINFRQISGIVIAIIGIFMVIDISNKDVAPDRLTGNLLILATGLAWALYNFVTQKVVQKYPTITVIFWQTLFGMIALLPLAFIEMNKWQTISMSGLLGALYLGVFCSVGAFLLYAYGLKSLQPGLAVILLNLVPVFGLIFAALFLQEKSSLLQLFGGFVVITGVIISLSAIPKITRNEAHNAETDEANMDCC